MASFEVKAKENSSTGGSGLNTGITLEKGDLLTVSVDPLDKWSAGGGPRESNANGLSNPYGGDFGLYTKNGFSFFYGSLIGSFDGGKTFFGVGTRLEMTILNNGGELSLYYWDCNNQDNSGSITAIVEVFKRPAV